MINLVGGLNPSEKYIRVRQLGWWHSKYIEIHKIDVPNHQPAIFWILYMDICR